jgi:membrane associated rhomboid family serine protease
MGINNLEHYRAQFRDDDGSSSRPPMSVVVKLVLITTVVFGVQILMHRPNTQGSVVIDWMALEPGMVFGSGQIWRLLTYAFCHSETNLMHIACNMLALFFLGRAVVQTIGSREFVALYLVAAVFAGIVQTAAATLWNAGSPSSTIGASGAVCAVFMLFVMHYPRFKLHLLGIVPIEARWLLAAVFVYDALGFLGLVPNTLSGGGASVAHAAHLGGVVFGWLYFRWDMNLTGWWDRFAGRTRQMSLPRTGLRVYNPETQPEVDYSQHIDRILAKISREGEASLSASERRLLTRASEHLKSHR